MTTSPRMVDLEWDLGDRLRKSLRVAGLNTTEMSEYIGVSRTSISAWMNSAVVPRVGMLRLWALRTGVPLEWLQTGECAIRDLNPEPADLEVCGSSLSRLSLASAA